MANDFSLGEIISPREKCNTWGHVPVAWDIMISYVRVIDGTGWHDLTGSRPSFDRRQCKHNISSMVGFELSWSFQP